MELADRSWCFFWYKEPDRLLKQQLKQILFLPQDLHGMCHMDLVAGGDHGQRMFQMTLQMLLHYEHEKEMHSFLFQIWEIDCPNDMTELLKNTILEPLGLSLK